MFYSKKKKRVYELQLYENRQFSILFLNCWKWKRLKQTTKKSPFFPRWEFFWQNWSWRWFYGHVINLCEECINWKDWCWCWNSNTSATWCKELTHWKRPWCWERLRAGGEGDDRRWDGWMALLTRWTWVWARSRSWWWTGKPGMLQSIGSQRVEHDWATELNWLTGKIMNE